jgi:hypothetical protein
LEGQFYIAILVLYATNLNSKKINMYQLLIDKVAQLEFVNSNSTIELTSLLDSIKDNINSNYRNIAPLGVSQKESDENGNVISFTIAQLTDSQNKEIKHNFPTEISDEEHSFYYKKGFASSVIDGFNMFVKTGLVVKK